MLEIALVLISGIMVGLSLGLTGSGGSLFAIPLLLFVVGMNMADAVPISMLVVGSTAFLGSIYAFKRKLLLVRPTIVFGVAGIIAAPLGLRLGAITPEYLRILAFSILAVVIAIRMMLQSFNLTSTRIVRAGLSIDEVSGVCRYSPDGQMRYSFSCAVAIVISGIVVGILSGFFGVGGGFLIVPSLMYIIRMDMAYAVGCSLAIIAMIGIAGGALQGVSILSDNPLALYFGIGSLTGVLLGRRVSGKIAGPMLQRIFAFMLFFTGIFMIVKFLAGGNSL